MADLEAEGKKDWADEVDPENELPPKTESGPDAQGVYTVVEWFLNPDGKRVKRTSKVKRSKRTMRVNKHVEARKLWKPFGLEGTSPAKSVTMLSTEEVLIELPKPSGKKKEEKVGNIVNFSAFHERLEARKRGELPAPSLSGSVAAGAAGADGNAAGTSGKYVPPNLRGGARGEGASMHHRDDANTLRINNLSEDCTEEDLAALFSPFGGLQRVRLAKNRNTGASRGFGFVTFFKHDDAERALEKMDKAGYDNLILRVEWSKPRTP